MSPRSIPIPDNYKPLIAAPPFPGISIWSGLKCRSYKYSYGIFFPADTKHFQQLAQDCADSRFYAGIHFKTDNETGLKMGKDIGKYITDTWMKK